MTSPPDKRPERFTVELAGAVLAFDPACHGNEVRACTGCLSCLVEVRPAPADHPEGGEERWLIRQIGRNVDGSPQLIVDGPAPGPRDNRLDDFPTIEVVRASQLAEARAELDEAGYWQWHHARRAEAAEAEVRRLREGIVVALKPLRGKKAVSTTDLEVARSTLLSLLIRVTDTEGER